MAVRVDVNLRCSVHCMDMYSSGCSCTPDAMRLNLAVLKRETSPQPAEKNLEVDSLWTKDAYVESRYAPLWRSALAYHGGMTSPCSEPDSKTTSQVTYGRIYCKPLKSPQHLRPPLLVGVCT